MLQHLDIATSCAIAALYTRHELVVAAMVGAASTGVVMALAALIGGTARKARMVAWNRRHNGGRVL